ncbi:phenoloxidase-activating factor 2 [Plodia interpunctella]|uniref:phenoloxidase-activating factor 2 n=1 Tax=Plodia interpunctella TaxID=58824 RepID=UPI002368A3D5|nr:phenoloxidase-activating factor 2 [Plodia interpunctella]
MYRLVLFLVASAWCQQNPGGGDLESVLQSIFGNPTSTSASPITNPAVPSGLLGDKKGESSTLVPGIQTSDDQDTTCTTEKGDAGECVRYYLCNVQNNTVITDGVGIIDIRVRDGPCPSYLDACCLVDDKRPAEDPITPKPPKQEEIRAGCGWRNPNGVGFRTTGDTEGESKFGEFPWMVAILKIEPVNDQEPDGQKLNVYVGGGSLIHPSVVLTAGHYVATDKRLRVRAGEWDTQTTKEIYPYQDRDVQKVEIHKDFNKGNLFYDIAVLFLSKPMDLAPNVGVACLPPARERARAGARCLASGWGKDKFGKDGRYQVILKKIELPVVDRNTCQDRLRKTRLGRHFELHTSFMCAGGGPGKDTCKGDGGSPLVCPIEFETERYSQAGIVAWGIGCGEDGTPGVYVDVGNLRNWIDDKVAGQGYDPKVYTY